MPLAELGCLCIPRLVFTPNKSSPNLDVARDRPGELPPAKETLILLFLSCLCPCALDGPRLSTGCRYLLFVRGVVSPSASSEENMIPSSPSSASVVVIVGPRLLVCGGVDVFEVTLPLPKDNPSPPVAAAKSLRSSTGEDAPYWLFMCWVALFCRDGDASNSRWYLDSFLLCPNKREDLFSDDLVDLEPSRLSSNDLP